MQVTDGEKFRNIISGMGRLYGNEPDALVLDAYWIALSDWSLDDFQAAAKRLMQTCKFMPRPADWTDLKNSMRMTAGEAFAKALTWAKSGDYRHPAKSQDAITIDRTVSAMGGWSALTGANESEVHWLEKRFAEHFAELQDVSATREALPGINDNVLLHPKLVAGLKRLIGGQ